LAVIIILIGPMGCGKTTIGELLAQSLGWPFYDGDEFHPPANVEKMRQGIPLNDEDRLPWLEKLYKEIIQWEQQGKNVILACSALKKTYRQILGINQNSVRSVYLKGSYELIQDRIGQRQHPYMDNNLLKSQFKTLEEPEDGLIVDISLSPQHIVQIVVSALDISTELKT